MVLESASNTSCTGTPSDIAFSRSTSTLSCGTVGRKNELMPVSRGFSRSAPRKPCVTSKSRCGSGLVRACLRDVGSHARGGPGLAALVPVLERHEHGRGVGLGAAAEKVEAVDGEH